MSLSLAFTPLPYLPSFGPCWHLSAGGCHWQSLRHSTKNNHQPPLPSQVGETPLFEAAASGDVSAAWFDEQVVDGPGRNSPAPEHASRW